MKNVFYFKNINAIGGVEQFFYYLSCLYKNMVVYYKKGDSKQIERLCKNIEVIKYDDNKIVCDRFFCNYGLDIEVEAKEKYQIIHCDYKAMGFKPQILKDFKYIAVSKLVADSFEEMTGIKPELIYNPIVINKPKIKKNDKLTIISATRVTAEKGAWRIDKLAEMLDKRGIEYIWYVYTNKDIKFQSKNVIVKPPKLDLTKEIAQAHWLAQLSNSEAYCYSVVQALMLDTPVIITRLPIYDELKVKEDMSIRVNFDLQDFDFDKLLQKLEFNYKPPKSNWEKYLDNNTTYNPNEIVEVECRKNIYFVKENKHKKRGEKIKITRDRACYLKNLGYVKY